MKVMALMVITSLVFCGVVLGDITKDEAEGYYCKGKYLRLKIDKVPSIGVNKLETLGMGSNVRIKIKPDGSWKESKILGMSKANGKLPKDTILEIRSSVYRRGDRKMIIKTKTYDTILTEDREYRTDIALKYFTIFEFRLSKDQQTDMETLKNHVSDWFDAFDTLDEAKSSNTVEIKEGMTVEEVEKILGKPKKKATIGNKLMYKYEEWKITFVDGKVTEIDF